MVTPLTGKENSGVSLNSR